MKDKIIKPLTREFLKSHNIEFNGANWSEINSLFELTMTDSENTWLVTIPGLPSSIPQPEPISNYTDLIRLYLSVMGGYVDNKIKNEKFISEESHFSRIAELVSEFFSFDNNIKIKLIITNKGLQITPNNAYTHTLINGNEFKFRYRYLIGDTAFDYEDYIAPECISTDYITDEIKSNEKIDKINLVSVEIWNNNKWEQFFGNGIKFD